MRFLLITGLLLAAPVAAAEEAPLRRALVVAFNGSDQPGMPPLRFADDDGVRWAESLRRLGVETTLLTVPDAETAEAERGRLTNVRAPTVAALDQAVKALAQRNAADRALGRMVDVFFIYVGHGRTDDTGRAYFTLMDGRLDQGGLYAQVVDKLEADFVHLFVDACHAAGVVGRRGGDPLVLQRLRRALEQEHLAGRPRVGAMFAESDEGETHEWSRIRAGVFSHTLRSALLGGADVNGDGRIEYSELDAFVASAIRGVKSPRARLGVRTFPPALSPARTLVGPVPDGPRLQLPAGGEYARLSVEDTLGVRLADTHRLAGEPLALALPEREAYWLRTPQGEARVALADLRASRLPKFHAPEVLQRGATEESLMRGLFAVPFGRSFYEGYVSSTGLPAVELPVLPAPGVPEPAEARPPPRGAEVLGLDVVLTLGEAPLDGRGLSRGLALAWRSPREQFHWGLRGSYALAPGAWVDAATLQRFSALAVGGVSASGPLAPFAEVGGGWLMLMVNRAGAPTQGDSLGFTARAATGVQWNPGSLGLRLAVGMDLDSVRVDGHRRWTWSPGIELGLRR